MPQVSAFVKLISFAVPAFLLILVAGLIISIFEQRWRTIALVAVPLILILWFGSHALHQLEILLARFARHRALAIISVAVLAFAASALIGASKGIREPEVTDEFSYLLAADTFARGRLSNPTHPMWLHFETIHVIHEPAYASKYPPAQGMILAFGKVVFGHPVFGVWLSVAMACAAICWMLMGWVSPRWALAGGVMTLFHPMFIEWSQSYWGGAAAMAGGALVTGALPRIIRNQSVRDAFLFGTGILVLATSRPYEGMILSLVAGVVLVGWGIKKSKLRTGLALKRIALPIVGMFVVTTLCIGYYNCRVTDDPLKLPYSIHEEKYGIAPLFLFQKLKPEPQYNHRELRELHSGWELSDYLNQQSLRGALEGARYKLMAFLNWNFRDMLFLIPLVALPASLAKDRRVRLALIMIVISLTAILLETWFLPHYTSLLVGLVMVVVARSMRQVSVWRWRDLRLGQQTIRATMILSAIMLVTFWWTLPPVDRSQWNHQRAEMIDRFRSSGEQNLVIVRYGPQHLIHQEWVHNEADIDSSPVIWARSMGEEKDRELIEYFNNSRVWLLEVNGGTAILKHYWPDSTDDTEH